MSNYIVDTEYYQWLLDQIDYYEGDGFDEALEIMFETPFEWDIPNDDNRAEDGIGLRAIFMEEENWHTEPLFEKECNTLEMFVALAMRIENDIMWDGETDRTSEWFWIMIRNMGIKRGDLPGYVYGKLEDFMHHRGGVTPFPLREKGKKACEIWFQAQQYLMEKYDF